jgi:sulfatase maturation enzyme AslB (radical SAM superfamily)
MISICSNGLLYFDERVQRYMQKHKNHLSFSITIDGNKELHDACRLRPNGEGSYDIAMAAVKDWMSKGYYMGSKITVAPGNVMYVFDAVKDIIENDYDDININCVYEEGWTAEHALILYE